MASFGGFTAAICVGKTILPYYAPETDDAMRTATVWIPSEAGQQYSVAIRQDDHPCFSVAYVCLDGSSQYAASHLLGGKDKTGEMKGHLVSQSAFQPFEFAKVKTTDDDQALNGLTDVGSIRVIFHRVLPPIARDDSLHATPDTSSVVHERAVKASSHSTRLGAAQQTKGTWTGYRCEPYTPGDMSPWVTFIFKYRPPAVLRAMGYMPMPLPEATLQDIPPPPSWPATPASRESLPREAPPELSRVTSTSEPASVASPPAPEPGSDIISTVSGSHPEGYPGLEQEMIAAEIRVLEAEQAAIEARRAAESLAIKVKRAALEKKLKSRGRDSASHLITGKPKLEKPPTVQKPRKILEVIDLSEDH